MESRWICFFFCLLWIILKVGEAMQETLEGSMLAFSDTNKNMAKSLFNSEGYFWLTTAVASSFAVEELAKYYAEVMPHICQSSQDILVLFNQCIRENNITYEQMLQARGWTLANLSLVEEYNGVPEVFNLGKSLVLSKCFTIYWLMFKLIEVEWQTVLELDEVAETYQFLDSIIADATELNEIEGLYQQNEALDDDQRVFLRSHWRTASAFWHNLCQDLDLLARGLVTYEPILA